MAKFTLTKSDIENIANEIMDYLIENELEEDVNIYYNNKLLNSELDEPKEGVTPIDYFKHVNYNHILSMSFEGSLYNELNYGSGRVYNDIENILDKYGLYFEFGDAWNLSVYPININNFEVIEYTDYHYSKPKQPKILNLYVNAESIPPEIFYIMNQWYSLSSSCGDEGGCVIGAGFEFDYNNEFYFMNSCSPYQGSCSWEKWIDIIKEKLIDIGASNINYKWGVLD